MNIVPLQPVPAQTLTVILNLQQVMITLRQMSTGLFMDLQNEGVEVVGLVSCQNLTRIVRDLYFGFEGDFVFYDTTGNGADPVYTGLGSRFVLVYLDPSDLSGGAL
jgi:hypothetical protein